MLVIFVVVLIFWCFWWWEACNNFFRAGLIHPRQMRPLGAGRQFHPGQHSEQITKEERVDFNCSNKVSSSRRFCEEKMYLRNIFGWKSGFEMIGLVFEGKYEKYIWGLRQWTAKVVALEKARQCQNVGKTPQKLPAASDSKERIFQAINSRAIRSNVKISPNPIKSCART